MIYHYRLWCPDCLGDPDGCFEGVVHLDSESFTTPQAAEEAAYEQTLATPIYEYEVIDQDGKVITIEA